MYGAFPLSVLQNKITLFTDAVADLQFGLGEVQHNRNVHAFLKAVSSGTLTALDPLRTPGYRRENGRDDPDVVDPYFYDRSIIPPDERAAALRAHTRESKIQRERYAAQDKARAKRDYESKCDDDEEDAEVIMMPDVIGLHKRKLKLKAMDQQLDDEFPGFDEAYFAQRKPKSQDQEPDVVVEVAEVRCAAPELKLKPMDQELDDAGDACLEEEEVDYLGAFLDNEMEYGCYDIDFSDYY